VAKNDRLPDEGEEFNGQPDDIEPDKLPDGEEFGDDDLLKLLSGEVSPKEESEEEEQLEGPLDTPEKFITPDLVELPPKWFYEAVKSKNLPRGMRLTDKMMNILDKVYFEGAGKVQLVGDMSFPSSTVNMAFRRIRDLWKMYKAGTLALDDGGEGEEQGAGVVQAKAKGSSKGFDINSRTLAMTSKTTTFKEIDMAIAEFLRPQIERSTQFQDVMARIGLVTTYAMLQLGVLDRSKFVTLAEAVASDPENLYKYVASQLDALINVVDAEKLKQFTRELLALREQNRQLALRVEELEYELQKHRDWLYEAGLILARVLGSLPYKKRVEVAEWYLKYQMAKGGGLIAAGGKVQDEEQ